MSDMPEVMPEWFGEFAEGERERVFVAAEPRPLPCFECDGRLAVYDPSLGWTHCPRCFGRGIEVELEIDFVGLG